MGGLACAGGSMLVVWCVGVKVVTPVAGIVHAMGCEYVGWTMFMGGVMGLGLGLVSRGGSMPGGGGGALSGRFSLRR